MTESKPKRIVPAVCSSCGRECRDATGEEVFPHRPDLREKIIWICPVCPNHRVGSDPKGRPLGTAAPPELRRARNLLHGRLDPLWQSAIDHPEYAAARTEPDPEERRKRNAIISRTARSRVYAFLASRLGIEKALCHVSLFDLPMCREAWKALRGVTYDDVRSWARMQKEKESDDGPDEEQADPRQS